MCAACIEYTKDKLTIQEFKSALKETTMDDRTHREQVEKLIENYGDDPDALKNILRPLQKETKDY